MEWGQQLFRLVLGSLPKIGGLLPQQIKRSALARLNDINPFATLGANDDLRRALRIAWIEAALKIDRSARDACASPDWVDQASDVLNFSTLLRERLKTLRDVAFDRNVPLSDSPVDHHLQEIIVKTPATLTGGHPDAGEAITAAFRKITANVLGCALCDIPDLYEQIAEQGLLAPGGSPARSFGDMVFVVFAELIQNPNRYPEAGKAFAFAISSLGVELGQQCLVLLQGQEERLDKLLETLANAPTGDGLTEWLGRIDVALASGWENFSARMDSFSAQLDQNTGAVHQFDTRLAQMEQIMAAVSEKIGSDQDPRARQMIFDLAQRLRPDDLLDFTRATQELEVAVCAALDIIAKGGTSYYKDRFVDDAHACVRRSIESGQLDKGSQAIDQTLAELDRREASEHETAKRQRKQLLNLSITHGTATHDPQRVADAEEKLLGIEHPDCPIMSEAFQNRLAKYFHEGEERGLNFPLDVAVALAHKRVKHASGGRERSDALLWLGKSLALLGERASSKDSLLQAEQVFRKASDDSLHASMPIEWAMAQSNLAGVLQTLGRREGRSDRFHEAVRIYQAALSVLLKEDIPLVVAQVQINLGAALSAIGEREGNSERIHEAVHIFQDALQEPSLKCLPLVWGTAQNNLGNALRVLGEREHSSDLLRAAVGAYRAALLERTHEVAPFAWATTQNDLGNALLTLGEIEGCTELLLEAVDAYQAAIPGRTRELAPQEWAITQHNLATAYWILGESENNAIWLEQARQVYQEALQERTRQNLPLDWASTKNNLGCVLRALSDLQNSPDLLHQAVQAYKDALKERTRERVPRDWAMTKYNLGTALLFLAEFEDGIENLQAAVQSYRDALLERTRERGLAAWVRTKTWLGHALLALGECETVTVHLDQAVQEYQDALPELSPQLREVVGHCIADAQQLLQERRHSEA